jgi:hypothetical protein
VRSGDHEEELHNSESEKLVRTALDGNSVSLVARDEDVVLEQDGDLGGGGHGDLF